MNKELLDLLFDLLSSEKSMLEFVLTNEDLVREETIELQDRLALVNNGFAAINEMGQPTPLEYETSADFTEEFTDIDEALKSVRMASWMRMTDSNYGTRAEARLANVHLAMDALWDELESAD